LVTIFDSVSYFSPDGEKNSPINVDKEPKPKKRKIQNLGVKKQELKIKNLGVKKQELKIKNQLYEQKPVYEMMLLLLLDYTNLNH